MNLFMCGRDAQTNYSFSKLKVFGLKRKRSKLV